MLQSIVGVTSSLTALWPDLGGDSNHMPGCFSTSAWLFLGGFKALDALGQKTELTILGKVLLQAATQYRSIRRVLIEEVERAALQSQMGTGTVAWHGQAGSAKQSFLEEVDVTSDRLDDSLDDPKLPGPDRKVLTKPLICGCSTLMAYAEEAKSLATKFFHNLHTTRLDRLSLALLLWNSKPLRASW
eukprot:s240_g30.t1